MEKLLTDQNLIVRLIDKVLDWQMKYFSNLLDEVGDLTEVVWMGDDWGTQLGPIINPKMFREIFVPRYKDFISMVKSKTSAKVALHSCGSVFWALDDLVSAGVEIIHPLQGDAEGMTDPYEINRRFGDQLVFYSNLRNQSVIPHGTASEVEQDVLEKIRALAPGGGLIMSGGHNIQADVPPENLISLVESVVKHGVYPLDS